MECEENGVGVTAVAGRRGVKRKRRAGGASDVRLALAPALPGAPAGPHSPRAARVPRVPRALPQPPRVPTPTLQPDQPPLFPPPFLNVNLMEEITFWICTRRAPCLYRYNNIYKKKNEEAQSSKFRHGSEPSLADEVPSPKKKKRKVKLLDDDESVPSERQQNVYFEKPNKQFWYSSSESETDDGSDVDFNIRNSSINRNKSKAKSQRKTRSTHHKKNKIVTSTPKPTTLRRSLRKSQQNLNNSSHLNCSFAILDSSAMNGDHKPLHRENGDDKNQSGYQNHISHRKKGTILKEQSKNEIVPNGQFEDISDVSGFTANYIRSTKMNSKTPRKTRGKPRNLVRDSQQKLEKDESKIIVCINKSVNTGHPPPALNQSTDSSQNVINLVTVNNNGKSIKVNQTTSQLKFLEIKDEVKECEQEGRQVNISFQSKSSGASRYPKRHRNNSKTAPQDLENSNRTTTPVKKKPSRGLRELKSINLNEHPDLSLVSRTRSGRKIGVTDLGESQCSQGQVNNVVDQVSSSVTKNVATPVNRSTGRKKRVKSTKKPINRVSPELGNDSLSDKDPCLASSSSPAKCGGKHAVDKTRQSLKRDSMKDKSGFAACFSDSEEDKPLIRRKFFC